MRWTTKLSCDVKLCEEFWCQKLLKSDNYSPIYSNGSFFSKTRCTSLFRRQDSRAKKKTITKTIATTTAVTREKKVTVIVVVASQISRLPVRTDYCPFVQNYQQTSAFALPTVYWYNHQCRRQLWGTGARAPPPSISNNFIFSLLWSKSDSQLYKYCVVCEISWCRCQQLAAISISTALVTKLLVIEQLLHPALKSTVSAHDIISIFAPPRNKSWRPHWSSHY